MKMLRKIKNTDDGSAAYWFMCPGCNDFHQVRIEGPGPIWTFNGDEDAPTFTPSLLVTGVGTDRRCHSFITGGQIRFLNDCTHDKAGQTMPIPEHWPDT